MNEVFLQNDQQTPQLIGFSTHQQSPMSAFNQGHYHELKLKETSLKKQCSAKTSIVILTGIFAHPSTTQSKTNYRTLRYLKMQAPVSFIQLQKKTFTKMSSNLKLQFLTSGTNGVTSAASLSPESFGHFQPSICLTVFLFKSNVGPSPSTL